MKIRTLLFLLGYIPMVIFSQTEVDSLKTAFKNAPDDSSRVRNLILLWEATAWSNPDEAKGYASEALKIAEHTGDKRGMAEAYQRLAAGYTVRNISDSAEYYYNKALSIFKKLQDARMIAIIMSNMAIIDYSRGDYVKALLLAEESLKKGSEANDEDGIAVTLQLLGNIHHFLGNYEEAQKYMLQSLSVFEKLKDKARYADGLVYLGNNYQELGKNHKAIANMEKAIQIYQELNDRFYLAQAFNNIGWVYYIMKDYDSAMYYFDKTIEPAQTTDNTGILLLAKSNQGLIYEVKKNYRKARSLFDESLALSRQTDDQPKIVLNLKNIGDLLSLQGNYKKALMYYDTAMVIARKTGSKSDRKDISLSTSKAWDALGNYEKSLEYYKKYAAWNDSIFSDTKARMIEEMEARFEKAKQEKEIAVQHSKIDILSKDIQIQRIKQIILIAGLSLAVLLILFFILHFRNKMKRNRLIREQEKLLEQEKLRNTELQRDNYEKELEIKKNELTSHALQMVQKNELLESLKSKISDMEEQAGGNRSDYRKLRFMINGSAQSDKEWENFRRHFEQVHQGFLSNLKSNYPVLTGNDLRLSAMLKLNLTSKEVAAIMNISPESVKKARYRLRKKLDLPEEADLHSFMMEIESFVGNN